MRSVLFAYHEIGCEAIRALKDMGETIAAVFTHADDPGENRWFGSVKETAEGLGIPVFTPEDVNVPEWTKKIEALRPDILFSFYYRKMISSALLRIPPKGALNLHGSLLPKYRGRAPVNWVLVHGETETGLTLHYMVERPDAGDIVAQKKVAIARDDTALTLYRKLVPLVRPILMETVPLLAQGRAPRIPQDPAQASYFGGRRPEDGRIDWTKSSQEIYNLIRAVTHPYPGAFVSWSGAKVRIWEARPDPKGTGSPGTIVSHDPLIVACGTGTLQARLLQSEGEEEFPGPEWARRHAAAPGRKFG